MCALTDALLVVLQEETVQQRPSLPSHLARLQQWLNHLFTRWVIERRLRIGLMIMLGFLGALTASETP